MQAATSAMQKLSLKPTTDYIGKVPGKTTIYTINIKPGAQVWRYDVEIVKPQNERKPEKSLTKQNDNGLRTAQREQ